MCVPRSVSCHNQIAGGPPILVHFSKGCYTSLHTFLIRLGQEDISVQSMFARFRSSIGSPTPIACFLYRHYHVTGKRYSRVYERRRRVRPDQVPRCPWPAIRPVRELPSEPSVPYARGKTTDGLPMEYIT